MQLQLKVAQIMIDGRRPTLFHTVKMEQAILLIKKMVQLRFTL